MKRIHVQVIADRTMMFMAIAIFASNMASEKYLWAVINLITFIALFILTEKE